MSTRKSITISIGDVFGRLTVLSEAPRRAGYRYWLCQCICGSPPKEIRQNSLGMQTKSCGCLGQEVRAANGSKNRTHGRSKTLEYGVWNTMWQRCTNPNNPYYELYKDKVPPASWKSFETFFADMGPRPSASHSIERVDNDKPYGPENCVWATLKEQSRNKSTNVNIEYQGRINCMSAWAEEFNLSTGTLWSRLRIAGWPIEKALTTKVGI